MPISLRTSSTAGVALLAGATLALSGCGATYSRSKTESFIKKNTWQGLTVSSATCPDSVSDSEKTFDCQLSFTSGQTGTLTMHNSSNKVSASDSDLHLNGGSSGGSGTDTTSSSDQTTT